MTKMFCILSITICSLGPTLANDIETLMTNYQKRVANIFLLSKSKDWNEFCNACSNQSFISSLQLLRENIEQEYQFQSFIENIENLSGIADANKVFLNLKKCLNSTILANYLSEMQTEPIDKIPHNVTLIILNLVTIFTKVLDSYNDELSQLLIISREEKTDLITIFVNKDSRLADWLIFKLIKDMFTISQKYTELLNTEIKHSYALIANEYVDEPNKIIYSYLDLYDRTQNLVEILRTNTHSIVEMILKLGNIASVNFFKPELTTELPLEFYYTLRLKFFSRKLNAFFGYIQYANRLFIMFPELDIKDPQILNNADLLKTTICGHIVRISRNVLQRNFFLHLLSTAAKSRFEDQIHEAKKLVGTIEKYILDNIKNNRKLK